MPQIKQLFFDCDNTLVLTEYLAFDACAQMTNEVLSDHNIKAKYTDEQILVDFFGLSFKGMVAALEKRYGFKVTSEKLKDYANKEEEAVIARLHNKAGPCKGSLEITKKIASDKTYNVAVVSSSAIRRIRAALENSGHDEYIPYDNVFSAASSLEKPTSKPNPAVYIHAMNKLGVKPEDCITVEDSKSGALAAVRAGIPCIAYVGAYHGEAKQKQVARTLTEIGCKAVMYNWSEYFDCLKEIEQS